MALTHVNAADDDLDKEIKHKFAIGHLKWLLSQATRPGLYQYP